MEEDFSEDMIEEDIERIKENPQFKKLFRQLRRTKNPRRAKEILAREINFFIIGNRLDVEEIEEYIN